MRLRKLPRGMPFALLILALVCAFIPMAAGGTVASAASPAATSVQFSQNPVPSGTAITLTGCGFGTVGQVTVDVFLGTTRVAGPTVYNVSQPGLPANDCFSITGFMPPTSPNSYTVRITADNSATGSNVLVVTPVTPAPTVTFAPNPAPSNVNVTATLCNITGGNPGTVSVLITNSSGAVVVGPQIYNTSPGASAGCYTFQFVSPTPGGGSSATYTVTVTGGTGPNAFTASNSLTVNGTTPPPTNTSLTFVSPVTSGYAQTATICGFPTGLGTATVTITSQTTNVQVYSAAASLTPTGTSGCYTFTLTAPAALDTYTVTVSAGGASASATLVVNTGVGTLQFSPNPASPSQTVTANNVCGFAANSTFAVSFTANNNGTAPFSEGATALTYNGTCYTLAFVAPPQPGTYTVQIGNGSGTTLTGSLTVSGTVFTPGTLTLSPSTAASGSTVVASGCGFSSNDTLTLTIYYYANSLNQVAATPTIISQPVFTGGGVNGYCYSVSFTVPNLPNGVYTVTLSGSVSGTVDSGTLNVNNGVCYTNSVYCCGTSTYCCTTTSTCCTTNSNCCLNNSYYCCTGTNYCCTTNCGCLSINSSLCCTTTTVCAAALTASPSTVVPGGSTTLSGTNFYPGAEVTISGLGTMQTVVASDGTFTTALTVPLGTAAGVYTVTATDSTGRTASTTVTVTTTTGAIQPNVACSAVGGVVTVTGSGFGAGEQVSLSLGAPSTAPYAMAGTIQLYTVSASGTFTVQYTVPNIAVGSYDLLALGQTSRVFVYVSFTVSSSCAATPPPVTVPTPVPVTPAPPVSVPTPALPSVNAGYTTTYFSDGYTGTSSSNGKASFTEQISLYNPGAVTAQVTTTYYVYNPATQARTKVTETNSVAPGADVVRVVNQDVGDNRMVSAAVTSSANIVAEERIDRVSNTGATLDNDSSLGTHQLGTTWYFSEGYTGISLQEYITLFNPGSAVAHAQIKYLPSDGSSVAPVSVDVPAQGQVTVNVRSQYNHLVPTGTRNIGAMVTSDAPISADRAMYWGDGSGSGKFGYSLAPGIASGATTQYFAMLPTSGGSQSFVTVLNPTGSSVTLSLQLRDASGTALQTVPATVGAHARYTFVLPSILSGDHGYVSGTLTSSQAVVAEAADYYGGSPNHGSHPGTVVQGTQGAQVGARADVNTRGALLSVFNPGTAPVRVQVTLGGSAGGNVVFDNVIAGGTSQLITLPAGSGARGVVLLASGTVTANVLNGGLGNATVWGGALNS